MSSDLADIRAQAETNRLLAEILKELRKLNEALPPVLAVGPATRG